MEGTFLNEAFWHQRKVLITGHTGFKGSWLAFLLTSMGARVSGFGLAPPTEPSLYEQAQIHGDLEAIHGEIAEPSEIVAAVSSTQPEVVFHLAAQSLVRRSHREPVETFRTNVVGTAALLEALRGSEVTKAVIVVTSDKCYENLGDGRTYDESSPLGGSDPYSSSKAAAELVVAAMRASFFDDPNGPQIATARGGNVIGACDWAADRLIPDLVRAADESVPALIRNPDATRPWQHALDCLSGYLLLAERIWEDRGAAGPWNFGPSDERPVRWVADQVVDLLPAATWSHDEGAHAPEASILRLDSSKAHDGLGWKPRLSIDKAIAWTIQGYRSAGDPKALRRELGRQLEEYRAMADPETA